jgi:CheY-like chemotaxis protein
MGARVLVVDDSSTIRKVVGAILARHEHESVGAPDGPSALDRLRRERFDLVLADCVMPRMTGPELCRALRDDPAIAPTPVVLMSALDEAISDDVLSESGAVDAIRKPFDARALVAVVDAALQQEPLLVEDVADGGPADEPDVVEDVDLSGLVPSARAADAGIARARIAADFGRAVSTLVSGSIARVTRGLAHDADVEAAIVRALGPEAVDVLAARLRELELGNHGGETLAGDLAAVPFGEVLQLLHLQRQTGICTVTDGRVDLALTMREGLVDLARGRGAAEEFRLGRYLVEEGLVTQDELAVLLRNRAGSRRLLGDMLVQYGIVAPEDVRRALARQTSELVYEVVRWRSGRFAFVRDVTAPEADEARLGLQVSALVLEGFRRCDEWQVIEQAIDPAAVFHRDDARLAAMSTAELTRPERLVLGAIDGRRTVREVLAAAGVGSFDGCKILYQLLQSRLVRRRAA